MQGNDQGEAPSTGPKIPSGCVSSPDAEDGVGTCPEEKFLRYEAIIDGLRASEKKYRGIVEQVNDWVWEIDADGLYTYASPRVRELLGYEPEEVLGTSPFDYMGPEESEKVGARFEPIFRAREEFALLENTLIRKDGGRVTVETSGVPVFDDRGAFVGYRGTDRDITERKRAEETIVRSEQMLQLVTDNIPQAIFWKDRSSTYLGCNKVFAKAAGLREPGDIVGKTDDDMPWAGEQAERFRRYDRLVMENDRPEYHIIERQREADGRVAWLETNKVPLHDAKGNVTGILGTYEDITDRKRAEEALWESEEKYRRIVEAANEGIWIIDRDSRTVFINDKMSSMLGYTLEEISGKTFIDFICGADLPRVRPDIDRHLRGAKTTHDVRFVRKDGGYIWCIVSASPILDDDGNFAGGVAMITDITRRKLAEEALREAKDQVELYVDLMGHDINNMNQVSLGFLELAHDVIEMEGKLGEDNIVLLDKAMDSLKNSSQLIDNVRKLRREKLGLYEPEVLEIGRVIDDAVEHFRGIPGREIRITRKPSEKFFVKANGLLKDVFVNLVGNAIKHSRGPLAVDIAVGRAVEGGRAYCRVDVEDNGPGIPDALKDTLFDRLSLSTTRAKGKGFGLCLIKMLVDDYHGKFWVEDRVPGDSTKGARFAVLLPAVEAEKNGFSQKPT